MELKEVSKLKSKIERLESRLTSYSEDHEHLLLLYVRMMKLENRIEELEEKIMRVSGDNVKELKAYLDKLLENAEFSDSDTERALSESNSSCEKLSFTDKESAIIIE